MKNSESQEEYEIDFERVVELVSKYEQIKTSGEIKKYNEESTKKDFILPLFEALGWNVYNRAKRNDSISAEETISKKRVDYGFRINGIPKFFLEAKSLKEENIQTNPKYITQAIDYAWMKSCSWAILCNFETIAVFNAEWKGANFGNNLLFALHPNDFISDKRFEHLSKVAFLKNELDDIASKYGKKQTKNTINKQLLNDMILFREVLSKDIVKNNHEKHLSQEDLDESVQRILDRLIFIRNAEDRELEENRLQSDLRQWAKKGKGQLIREISKVYAYFDQQYNSKLFAKHLCDDLYLDNEVLIEVIEGLNHSKDNSYRYDFSIIESDVLGNIYEQYLGNILKSTPKRAKLSESRTHRKEQGIYYTPSYIVDYIVKNTVGEYIKTHKPEEIKKVKILDPACGSGSFLIRAYKELENYWIKELKLNESDVKQTKFDLENSEQFYTIKTDILRNNIFGVDLDPKAVEIAQLNLLLQVSERKHRLPILQNNIKVGNSLVNDPNVSDKAFKWVEEFPEIMNNGGFDVVIGNPPYVNVYLMDEDEREYFNDSHEYQTTHLKYDLYTLFIEKGIKVLKENGYLGYIVPYPLLNQPYAELLRKYVLDTCSIVSIVDLSGYFVFKEATVKTIIPIFRKEILSEQRNKNKIKVSEQDSYSGLIEGQHTHFIEQSFFQKTHQNQFRLTIDNRTQSFIDKMKSQSISLGDICYVSKGIVAYSKSDSRTKKDFLFNDNSNHKRVRYLEGKDVERYSINFKNLYLEYDPLVMSRPTFPELHEMRKILVRAMSNGLLSTYDNKGYYADQKLIICSKRTVIEEYIVPSKRPKSPLAHFAEKYDERYIVGLLNSSLMWYYYRSTMFGGLSILPEDIRNLPIKKIDFSVRRQEDSHNSLVDLVDRMLSNQ